MAQQLNSEISASALLYEKGDTKAERRRKHLYPSLTAIAGIALSVAGLNALNSNESAKADSHNDHITSIVVENGAKFRDNPWLGDSADPNFPIYQLESHDDNTLVIETPHGVSIKTNNNGEWYGIPGEDLSVAIPEIKSKVEADPDDTIWINHVLAVPQETNEK